MEAVSPDAQLAIYHHTLTATATMQNSLAAKPLNKYCWSESQALEVPLPSQLESCGFWPYSVPWPFHLWDLKVFVY